MLNTWIKADPQNKYPGKVNEVLSSIVRDAARARMMAATAKDEIEFYVAQAQVAMAADEFDKLYTLGIIDQEDYEKYIAYCNRIAENIKAYSRREVFLCKGHVRKRRTTCA